MLEEGNGKQNKLEALNQILVLQVVYLRKSYSNRELVKNLWMAFFALKSHKKYLVLT